MTETTLKRRPDRAAGPVCRTRRDMLAGLGAAGVLGLAGPRLGRAAAASQPAQIRFDGWGGVVSEAFKAYAFEPFEAATGIDVVSGTFGGADEFLARAQISRPGTYNLVHLSGVFDYRRYHTLGLSTDLDAAAIPNLRYTIPALTETLRAASGGTLSGVPYSYGLTGIAYNRRHVSDAEVREKQAAILIDPKYAGRISGWSDWRTRIWYGAAIDGQDPNAIADMDPVWANIRAHRDLALKYWHSGAELMSLLAEEEVFVTDAWSGRVAALQERGFDIGFYQPDAGIAWQECIFVLRGSPVEACQTLLNFMLEPEVAIAVAKGQKYPPALDPRQVELDASVRELPGFQPGGDLSGLNFFDPEYWNANERAWSRTFSRVQRGF